MNHFLKITIATTFLLAMGFCFVPEKPAKNKEALVENTGEFDAYWYAGKAEISTYSLSQARYGELHPGKSILIFVTEDFLIDKQVKKESDTQDKSTSVLKMNKIDRFVTGIYDYSLMLSTFTPVDQVSYPFCLKTTFSAQDWCGQSFLQINKRGNGYQAMLSSYFESEGDKNTVLEHAVLEDELWTRARLDPKIMPIGDFEIIPSSQQLRLRHEPLTSEAANGKLSIEVKDDGSEQFVYVLKYASGRELKMYIQTVFPYRIFGWEEKVKSGFGANAKWLTSTATLDKTIKSSYWAEHGVADAEKRSELGLDY